MYSVCFICLHKYNVIYFFITFYFLIKISITKFIRNENSILLK